MAYNVFIQPNALEELKVISEYIEQYNPQKAIDEVNMLVRYFTKILSDHPKAGVIEKGTVRKLNHKKYSAFYTINHEKKELYILHIVDLAKPLEERQITL